MTARTAEANRLHADLSILLPGHTGRLRSLVHPDSVTMAAELLDASEDVRAGVARRRIGRLRRVDDEITDLTTEINHALGLVGTTLTVIHGVA